MAGHIGIFAKLYKFAVCPWWFIAKVWIKLCWGFTLNLVSQRQEINLKVLVCNIFKFLQHLRKLLCKLGKN